MNTPASRKILQITSYPPPRGGWGVRVEFLKRHLEALGHECVVLNIGSSRTIPSTEYDTVLGAGDYVRKVRRYLRRGFVPHIHVNGASPKGFALALTAEVLSVASGRRPFLTFHAGTNQVYFPRPKYPLLWPMFWLLFTLPRAIICNSDAVKAKIMEYGIGGRKIVPIPAFSRQYLEAAHAAMPEALSEFYARFPETIFSYAKIRPVFHPETLVEGFARLASRRPGAGLVLCGIAGHMESGLWPKVQRRIGELAIGDRLIIVDDLPHEVFMTALGRASVYLRTPDSDGVCSSVLESLALGVPVVAAENFNRPAGVVTYPATDADAMAAAVGDVLARRAEYLAAVPRIEVRDTVDDEAQLLTR